MERRASVRGISRRGQLRLRSARSILIIGLVIGILGAAPCPIPAQPPATAGLSLQGISGKRVMIRSRGSLGTQVRSFPSPDGMGQVSVIESGVRIIIEDVTSATIGQLGNVELEADRMVIWTTGIQATELMSGQAIASDTPIEVYAQGNIVFRQGLSVVFAEQMYYDVVSDTGVVLDAEVNTPVPRVDAWGYDGYMRVRADVLSRLGPDRFEAATAAATTSRLGVPSYWLQAGSVTVDTRSRPDVDSATGLLQLDPLTGQPSLERVSRLTSRNNLVYLGGWPVFYWPWLVTDLQRPTTVLESVSFNNDAIFGTQVRTRWNLFQLLGTENPPEGTQWLGAVDYLSDRGVGFGSTFNYDRDQLLGHPGRAFGFLDAWFIDDRGLDRLGFQRSGIPPEEEFRGRVLGRHRQWLHDGYQLTGELGWISDRNFLEQFYEAEWDLEKDQTTGLEWKRSVDNHAWSVVTDARLNEFFTQTEWLPRLDHYWLGQPLLGEHLTWHSHTNAGFARLRTATAPSNPASFAKWDPLAWEVAQEGARAVTRQEIDLPVQLGPLKVVPYLLGEIGYWNDDLQGDDLTRWTGQAGMRLSLPMWSANSAVQSQLFNLSGLAHKIVWEAEWFWADSNQDPLNLPLYDPLDDDSIEYFRRRFFFDTFGGLAGGDVPLPFDERTFALRSGLQRWVTSPSPELAGDLNLLRLAARQRWQTRRGSVGRQRIVDWITLDAEAFVYPDSSRDNFGESIGLLQYDFRWHLGDRLTLLSDGFADTFQDGLKTASLGGAISRPGRGRYYAGIRSVEGPISSHILNSTASYRLSPKWIVNYISSYDLGAVGNIGQAGSIVRVGESFLVSVGANYDVGRDNFGVRLLIVPRFIRSAIGTVAGIPIPPVGADGLE